MKKNSKKIIHHEFKNKKNMEILTERKLYLLKIFGINFNPDLFDEESGNYNCKNCTNCENCIGCINCENCNKCICCKNIKNTQDGFWINFISIG